MEDKAYKVATLLCTALKAACPFRSGNLASTIHVAQDPDGLYVVIGNENIDYAAATNEPWISPKWNGKKNPNEGWVENTIKKYENNIKAIFQGEMTEEELNRIIQEQELLYQSKVDARIEAINKA